jgi:transcription elongation GreA/GreB family factor
VACMCGRQGALTCGGACGCSGESSLLGAVEKATAEAEKHGDRSEKLSALVAEAKGMIEQAKTKQAERAKAAAAVTAAAEAAEAAQRLHDEEELAALTLRVQQVQARLGSSVVPPADAEETMCVVCFDAPKDHILVPCYHLCVCEACANLLTQMDKPTCPICRAAIRQTNKVFQS